MISPKKAIFWDNDGILVDTEKYYFEATRQILQKAGFELTKALYTDLFLVQSSGAWHLLDQEKYPPDIIRSLRKERDELYHTFLHTQDIVMDGIEQLVARLSQTYRMAIVTSSKPGHFYAIHERTGLLKYFEFAVTAEDYTHSKPDPEPYLVAMNRMGVSASESIAIEDSRRGLIAAKSAGMACIIVKNELTETSDFTEADVVLNHVRDLSQIL